MRLTWHDAVATVLVAAATALYLAFRAGVDAAFVSGPRVLAVVVFVLGVSACAAGGGGVVPADAHDAQTAWTRAFGVHGAIAFVLMLLVLITANTGLLAVLTGLVVLLWLVTTVRHAIMPAEHGGRAADRRPTLQR
jgi:hypothetical protein